MFGFQFAIELLRAQNGPAMEDADDGIGSDVSNTPRDHLDAPAVIVDNTHASEKGLNSSSSSIDEIKLPTTSTPKTALSRPPKRFSEPLLSPIGERSSNFHISNEIISGSVTRSSSPSSDTVTVKGQHDTNAIDVITQNQTELLQLRQKHGECDAKLQQSEKQVKELVDQVERQKMQIKDFERERNIMLKDAATYKSSSSNTGFIFQEKSIEVGPSLESLNAVEETAVESEQRSSSQEREERIEAFEAEKLKIRANFEKIFETLKKENEELLAEHQKTVEELTSLKKSSAKAQEDYRKVKKSLDQMIEERDAFALKGCEDTERMKEIVAEKRLLIEEKKELRNRLSQCEEEVVKYQERIRVLELRVADLSKEAELSAELKAELEQCKLDVEALRDSDAKKSQQLSSIYEELTERLTKDFEGQLAERDEKEKACMQKANDRYRQLESTYLNDKKQLTDENEALRQQTEDLSKKLQQLEIIKQRVEMERDAYVQAKNTDRTVTLEYCDQLKLAEEKCEKLSEDLEKYRTLETELHECERNFEVERIKAMKFEKELELERTDARKFREEADHMRHKVKLLRTELAKAKLKDVNGDEIKTQMEEFRRLHREVDGDLSQKAELDALKKNLDERTADIARRDVELLNLRSQILEMEKELVASKEKRNEAEILSRRCQADFAEFQRLAEIQYQEEIDKLITSLGEKDERICRLHDRLAQYEQQSSRPQSQASRFSSKEKMNATVWDFVPDEIKRQLMAVKDQYKELDSVVQSLMGYDIKLEQSALASKVVEDKETDCDDLVSVYSQQSSPWIRTEGDRQVVISSKLDLQTCSESARFEGKTQTVSKNMSNRASSSSAVLKTLLEEVRLAETKWKLGINIRHLLEGLLYSVHHSSGDQQYIHSAVDRFFDGVEMALKRTLTTSEDNWRKCEKLTVELQEVREDRRLALDRESIIQATVDSLRSELRTSRVEITGLKNMLEKSRQEKVTLSSLLDGRQNALAELQQRCEEQRHDVKRATDTIQTMLNDAQDDERVITQLVEELRILNCQKEELKRQLADRESEIAKLEGSLAGFVSEASTTSQYIKKLEAMKDDYQQKYVHFRRKAEKRENFLVEMEAIIKALLIRNDGLRYTNRKRQDKIDLVFEFLARHLDGFDPASPHDHSSPSPSGDLCPSEPGSPTIKGKQHKSKCALGDTMRRDMSKLSRRLLKHSNDLTRSDAANTTDNIVMPRWRKSEERPESNSVPVNGSQEPAGPVRRQNTDLQSNIDSDLEQM